MFPEQSIKRLACVVAALLANAILANPELAAADNWSSPNDCGCGNHFSPTSWSQP